MRFNTALLSLFSLVNLSVQSTSTASASSSVSSSSSGSSSSASSSSSSPLNLTSTCYSFDTSIAESSVENNTINLFLLYEDGIEKYETSPILGYFSAVWSQPYVNEAGVSVGSSQVEYLYSYQVDLAKNLLVDSADTCGNGETRIVEIAPLTHRSLDGISNSSLSKYDIPYIKIQINKAFVYNTSVTLKNEESVRPVFRLEGAVYSIPEESMMDYYMGDLKLSSMTMLHNFTLSATLGDPTSDYMSNYLKDSTETDEDASATQAVDAAITVQLQSTTSGSNNNDKTDSYETVSYATDSDYDNEESCNWETETGYDWETESYPELVTQNDYVYSVSVGTYGEGYELISTISQTSASASITDISASSVAHKASQSSVTSVAASTSASSTSTSSGSSSSAKSSSTNGGAYLNIKSLSFFTALLSLFI